MEINNGTVVNLEGNNEFVRVYAKQYDKDSGSSRWNLPRTGQSGRFPRE